MTKPAVIAVNVHTGERAVLWPLFRLADASDPQIRSYIDEGVVLVARTEEAILGHLLLVDTGEPGAVELKSMAVDPTHQGAGVGRQLVDAAVVHCRGREARRLVVSTATADVGNLRFYQRVGFRMARIERDAFTP